MLREHSSSRKAFSAIFVYVTTAGTVYTEQKQKKWGKEKNLKFSCMLETCWLKFNRSGVQTRTEAADLSKSQAFGCRGTRETAVLCPLD